MLDLKPVELSDHLLRLVIQPLQILILHLVDALHLTDQQLGIANYLQRFLAVLNGVTKRRQQPVVFRYIIRLVPEIVTKLRHITSCLIRDKDTIPRWSWIPTRPAIYVRDNVRLWSTGTRK